MCAILVPSGDTKGTTMCQGVSSRWLVVGLLASVYDSAAAQEPVDCVLSLWGPWMSCSASCGGGEQARQRSIVAQAQHGGNPCGMLVQARLCNTQLCPVDCMVTQWRAWDACSVCCGGGHQARTREILAGPQAGGMACPMLYAERGCNTQACAACASCPAGTFRVGCDGCSVGNCRNCDAGRFKDVVGTSDTACKNCPGGKFQENQGQSQCLNCLAGRFQSGVGQAQCSNCPGGRFQSGMGKAQCFACPPGQFQSQMGSADCFKCPYGKFQWEQGKSYCYPATACASDEFESAPPTGVSDHVAIS